MSASVKNAKNWGFVPYFGLKNMKKWRISAGLRAKSADGATVFDDFLLGWVVCCQNMFFHKIIGLMFVYDGCEHCRFGSVAVDGMMLHSKGVAAKTAELALKQLRMYVSRHCDKVNSR